MKTDGTTQFSYSEPVEGDTVTLLGEIVDMTCETTFGPGPGFRQGTHDFKKNFSSSERTSGCADTSLLSGTFDEFFASGKGTYYVCFDSSGQPQRTHSFEFTDISEYDPEL